MSTAEIIAELAHLGSAELAAVRAWLDQSAAAPPEPSGKTASSTLTPNPATPRLRSPRLADPARARNFVKQVVRRTPMPRYDATAYDPPAPVARVSLRPSTGGPAVADDVKLLIDTGADVTLLPRAADLRLGVKLIQGLKYELYGFDRTRTEAEAVEPDLHLLGQTFRGRYLLTNDAHGLLGRDVLNMVSLTLDGPQFEWEPG